MHCRRVEVTDLGIRHVLAGRLGLRHILDALPSTTHHTTLQPVITPTVVVELLPPAKTSTIVDVRRLSSFGLSPATSRNTGVARRPDP